jgi:hypothetical protein
MKKGTLILISCLAMGLFVLTYCTSSKKPLFYQEDGNYFVDNNFIVKATTAMSADDVSQLLALEADTNYSKLTKGTCFLLTTARVGQILRTGHIATLTKIARLTRYEKITRILDIHRGCFEMQQIDWAQFGDLKAKLDAILNKYNPAMVDGNISITNNQIATSAVALKADDVAQLDKMTISGADEVDICADYMGPNKFTRILRTARSIKPDKTLQKSLDKILVTYQ